MGRKGRAPTKGSWQKGQSGNPQGRSQLDLVMLNAEIRKRTGNGVELVEWAVKTWRESDDEKIRVTMHGWLCDRLFGKAIATVDMTVSTPPEAPPPDLSVLPLEQRLALLANLRALREATEDASDGEPTDAH